MTASPRLSPFRRYPADATDWFSDDEVRRGRAYHRPVAWAQALQWVIGSALVLGYVHGNVGDDVVDAVGLSGWLWELVVIVVSLEIVSLVYRPWFSAWRSFVHDKRWDLSTMTWRTWFADQAKELVLATLITLVLAVPLFAVIRGTDVWWVWGWLIFTAFSILFGFLFPVVFAPIFNKFERLDDDEIAPRVRAVAVKAGLQVEGVYVADASLRSRATNAYVAGLGKTRRVVLYDTILEWPPDLLEQVVAHELGHWRHGHLARQLPLLAVLQFVAFFALAGFMEWGSVLDWIGVESVGDPRTYPLLFLVYPAILGSASLVLTWLGRAFERQADLHALSVLEDPDAFEATFRRLAEDNKADVDPPWWRAVRQVHPPVPERLAMAEAWRSSTAR